MRGHEPARAQQSCLELQVPMAGAPISPLLELEREGVFQPLPVTVFTLLHLWLRLVSLVHLHLQHADFQRLRHLPKNPFDDVTHISRGDLAP